MPNLFHNSFRNIYWKAIILMHIWKAITPIEVFRILACSWSDLTRPWDPHKSLSSSQSKHGNQRQFSLIRMYWLFFLLWWLLERLQCLLEIKVCSAQTLTLCQKCIGDPLLFSRKLYLSRTSLELWRAPRRRLAWLHSMDGGIKQH